MNRVIIVDKRWTLFLDRDGVINKKKENDYIKTWDEFSFIKGSVKAISKLSAIFGRVIIVTNQRGIGKKLMTELDLKLIHNNMKLEISKHSGFIDKIYYCTQILDTASCRKPNSGMAMLAKKDFPEINFSRSFVIGDSRSDIDFGRKLGSKTVFISSNKKKINFSFDFKFKSLYHFSKNINIT
jgi:histidinol-phosphate phosphatase family protein